MLVTESQKGENYAKNLFMECAVRQHFNLFS